MGYLTGAGHGGGYYNTRGGGAGTDGGGRGGGGGGYRGGGQGSRGGYGGRGGGDAGYAGNFAPRDTGYNGRGGGYSARGASYGGGRGGSYGGRDGGYSDRGGGSFGGRGGRGMDHRGRGSFSNFSDRGGYGGDRRGNFAGDRNGGNRPGNFAYNERGLRFNDRDNMFPGRPFNRNEFHDRGREGYSNSDPRSFDNRFGPPQRNQYMPNDNQNDYNRGAAGMHGGNVNDGREGQMGRAPGMADEYRRGEFAGRNQNSNQQFSNMGDREVNMPQMNQRQNYGMLPDNQQQHRGGGMAADVGADVCGGRANNFEGNVAYGSNYPEAHRLGPKDMSMERSISEMVKRNWQDNNDDDNKVDPRNSHMGNMQRNMEATVHENQRSERPSVGRADSGYQNDLRQPSDPSIHHRRDPNESFDARSTHRQNMSNIPIRRGADRFVEEEQDYCADVLRNAIAHNQVTRLGGLNANTMGGNSKVAQENSADRQYFEHSHINQITSSPIPHTSSTYLNQKANTFPAGNINDSLDYCLITSESNVQQNSNMGAGNEQQMTAKPLPRDSASILSPQSLDQDPQCPIRQQSGNSVSSVTKQMENASMSVDKDLLKNTTECKLLTMWSQARGLPPPKFKFETFEQAQYGTISFLTSCSASIDNFEGPPSGPMASKHLAKQRAAKNWLSVYAPSAFASLNAENTAQQAPSQTEDEKLVQGPSSAKQYLQEWSLKHYGTFPEYKTQHFVDASDGSGKFGYVCTVTVGGQSFVGGFSPNLKSARQRAARKAIIALTGSFEVTSKSEFPKNSNAKAENSTTSSAPQDAEAMDSKRVKDSQKAGIYIHSLQEMAQTLQIDFCYRSSEDGDENFTPMQANPNRQWWWCKFGCFQELSYVSLEHCASNVYKKLRNILAHERESVYAEEA